MKIKLTLLVLSQLALNSQVSMAAIRGSSSYAFSVNNSPLSSMSPFSGGNEVALINKQQTSQSPVLKFIRDVKSEDLVISVPMANSEYLVTEYNNAIKSNFNSQLVPFKIQLTSESESTTTQTSAVEFSDAKIKGIVLPEFDASIHFPLMLTYKMSVGSSTNVTPQLPLKIMDNVTLGNLGGATLSINGTSLQASKISSISVKISGETTTSSEVDNFKITVSSRDAAFLKTIQEKQFKSPNESANLVDGSIDYTNHQGNSVFKALLSKIGVVAVRAIPTNQELRFQKFEVEFFVSKLTLLKK